MSKIYIVKSSEGEYEDYHIWNEKAFLTREDAEAYAKELDNEHNKRPHFVTDEFICLLRECESKLPEWEDFPEQLTTENRETYFKWQEEQEKKQNKLLFELMYKRGQFMTQEMYDQYNEWENNSYTRWYPCEIEELELI